MAAVVTPEGKLSNNSCRICLEAQYPACVKITKEMITLIKDCFGVQVINGSHKLCTECAVYIAKFNAFKQKVIKSNDIWESYSQKSELSTEKKENEIKCEIDSDIDNSETQLCDGELDHKSSEGDQKNCSDADVLIERISEQDLILTRDERIAAIVENYQKNKIIEAKKGKRSKFTCKNCDKTYKRKVYLIRHQQDCDGLEYNTAQKQNKNKIHNSNTVLNSCGLCSMSSESKEDINKHIAKHFSNNDLECKICGFQGIDFAEMEGHRYKHYDKKQKHPRTCHVCNKMCIASKSLIFHFRSVHLNMKGSTCKYCNKFITTYRGWKKHEQLHISHNFICDICGLKFIQRNSIITHMKRHYGVKEHVCDICGKAFSRSSYLKVHLTIVHTSQDPVKCSHCDREYKSQFHLDQHMKDVNANKPFQCEICLKFYVSEARLKKHAFWHSGERPFACHICNVTYKAKSTLNVHMKESHSSYRPFKCTVCDKGFVTNLRLQRHRSMHTGVRKYKCAYCDRSFHAKAQLVAHSSTQHKAVKLLLQVNNSGN